MCFKLEGVTASVQFTEYTKIWKKTTIKTLDKLLSDWDV